MLLVSVSPIWTDATLVPLLATQESIIRHRPPSTIIGRLLHNATFEKHQCEVSTPYTILYTQEGLYLKLLEVSRLSFYFSVKT